MYSFAVTKAPYADLNLLNPILVLFDCNFVSFILCLGQISFHKGQELHIATRLPRQITLQT